LDLQRASHSLTPRRRSRFAKFRLPGIQPSGAVLVWTGRDQPLPRYRLASPALAAACGAFKQEGARGYYTHTRRPRARVDDKHPLLPRALRRSAARHTQDAPSCSGRRLPSHHSWRQSPAWLFVICQGALPSFPLPPPASTLVFFTAK